MQAKAAPRGKAGHTHRPTSVQSVERPAHIHTQAGPYRGSSDSYTHGSEVKVIHSVMSLLFATPWTVAHQAPLFLGFSRQEYWSGLPIPSTGDLPDPGIEPESPELWADSLPAELPEKPFAHGFSVTPHHLFLMFRLPVPSDHGEYWCCPY